VVAELKVELPRERQMRDHVNFSRRKVFLPLLSRAGQCGEGRFDPQLLRYSQLDLWIVKIVEVVEMDVVAATSIFRRDANR
jgi:hypothetical protein